MTFRLRPQAKVVIEAIALYIASDSPSAAKRWFDAIQRRCENIGEIPEMGVSRPDIRASLPMLPFGNYLILYEQAAAGAQIVRVMHGARQWQELL